jgi:polyphenol oxidase
MAGRPVREELVSPEVPLWAHPDWTERFPWLVQGTTGQGSTGDFDLGLFGSEPAGEVLERWASLRRVTGMPTSVHARQVHGSRVRRWEAGLPDGMVVAGEGDAHLCALSGVLLTVSVADCVHVFLVDPERRLVVLVHAGWRGVAGGIVERALDEALAMSGRADSLWVHCGPAICGECYEVGPEVHLAIAPERAAPSVPEPIDLRAAIAGRVIGRGTPPRQVSVSTHCTRCSAGQFFSHRAGSPARQLGVLGLRE